MDYRPWSCKELDTTEKLTHTHTYGERLRGRERVVLLFNLQSGLVDWRPRHELISTVVQVSRPPVQNSLLHRVGQFFVLVRPSTNWMRPTHIIRE